MFLEDGCVSGSIFRYFVFKESQKDIIMLTQEQPHEQLFEPTVDLFIQDLHQDQVKNLRRASRQRKRKRGINLVSM